MPLFSALRFACFFLRIITVSLSIRFSVDFGCSFVETALNLLWCFVILLLSINMELFSILVLKIF